MRKVISTAVILFLFVPTVRATDDPQVTALRSQLFQLQTGHAALQKQYDSLQEQLKKVEGDIAKLHVSIQKTLKSSQASAAKMAKDLQTNLEKELQELSAKLNELGQRKSTASTDPAQSGK